MKKNISIFIAIIICIYLDSVLFNRINIANAKPDALIALMASLGVLIGGLKAGSIAVAVGLFFDCLFEKYIGLSAIALLLTASLGGMLYEKYYADNIIMPAVVACIGTLIKNILFAAAAALNGADFSIFSVFASYILPSTLLTVAFNVPAHVVLKRLTRGQLRGEHRHDRERRAPGGIA